MNFTMEEAKEMASLAQAAYCPDHPDIYAWTCKACKASNTPVIPGTVKLVDTGDQNATHVLMARLAAQEGCFISFRGSSNPLNWVRDFDFEQADATTYNDCDGCKVHHGFYTIWENIRNRVIAELDDIGCNEKQNNLLYVTGHSLGGALSHLAMFTLARHGFNIGTTYSFEAPRVGNKAFAEAFKSRFDAKYPTFRITHKADPAVHVPTEPMGYWHVDTEVWFDENEQYHICDKEESNSCSNKYNQLIIDLLLHSADHCNAPALFDSDTKTFCAGQTDMCQAEKAEVHV